MTKLTFIKNSIAFSVRSLTILAGGNALMSSIPKLFSENSEIIKETYEIIPPTIIYLIGLSLFIGGIFILIKETSIFATLTLIFPAVLSFLSGMIFDEEISTWPMPSSLFAGILAVIIVFRISYLYINQRFEQTKLSKHEQKSL